MSSPISAESLTNPVAAFKPKSKRIPASIPLLTHCGKNCASLQIPPTQRSAREPLPQQWKQKPFLLVIRMLLKQLTGLCPGQTMPSRWRRETTG